MLICQTGIWNHVIVASYIQACSNITAGIITGLMIALQLWVHVQSWGEFLESIVANFHHYCGRYTTSPNGRTAEIATGISNNAVYKHIPDELLFSWCWPELSEITDGCGSFGGIPQNAAYWHSARWAVWVCWFCSKDVRLKENGCEIFFCSKDTMSCWQRKVSKLYATITRSALLQSDL